jgi:HAD superfamily hydrolase (TIGR01456 family)
VLLHTSKPIPGATETLRFLQRNNIPFILLTNGGGKSEAERVADLTEKLGVELDVSNFVQSHTPFQKLLDPDVELGYPSLEEYLQQSLGRRRFSGKETVLVLGSDASKARRIANGYGFESVVTPGDILKACPEIFPFDPLREFYDRQEILPLPKPIYSPKADPAMRLEDCLKIDGILTFNDPRDWAVDIQLVTDLLLSHRGYLGSRSGSRNGDETPALEKRWQGDGQPPLIFSNVDLQWSTGYHQSRLGQGSFRGAVRDVMSRLAAEWGNMDVKTFEFGKPYTPTYAHAWDTLERHRRRLGLPDLNAVYMVGDNPASDIKGAYLWNTRLKERKSAGPYWRSCLVRTGVWKEDIVPVDRLGKQPTHVVDDVRAAVQRALKEQKWPGNFE